MQLKFALILFSLLSSTSVFSQETVYNGSVACLGKTKELAPCRVIYGSGHGGHRITLVDKNRKTSWWYDCKKNANVTVCNRVGWQREMGNEWRTLSFDTVKKTVN